VLGCQGLWPGRRAAGYDGTRRALRLCEGVQVDPLKVVARSHDLVLHSRVLDYRPYDLEDLMYVQREFFDYGGLVRILPMDELPYVRRSMAQVPHSRRWRSYEDEHAALLTQVRGRLESDGPLAARDFPGVGSRGTFRSSKETSVALYYLWLTGELMTHRRRNFERVYAPRADIAPPELDYVATESEAEGYAARKAARSAGLSDGRTWAARFHRWVVGEERRRLLAGQVEAGFLARIRVEGEREMHYVPTSRLAYLEQIDSGGVPPAWRPLGPDTTQEAVLLSPFDVVCRSSRGTFDFEFLFEAYKPAARRRWGYYVLPVLYGDDLVARVEPRYDRKNGTLVLDGLWFEHDTLADDEGFVDALAAGLVRLASLVGATRVDVDKVQPARVRSRLSERTTIG
jgi:uncharacterized protein